MSAVPLADDLLVLALDVRRSRLWAPLLDELLAAGDVAEEVLAGTLHPGAADAAVEAQAGATRSPRVEHAVAALAAAGTVRVERRRRFGLLPVEHVELVDASRLETLVSAVERELADPVRATARTAMLAALALVGDVADRHLSPAACGTAAALASGEIRLPADPDGRVPAVAGALRRVRDRRD